MKPPTNVVSPFLTVDEAAQYMRQCSRTVQTLCRSGELPARKLGKSWLILRTDLEQLSLALAEAAATRWQARLWDRLDKTVPHGCWLWTGPVNRHGYGSIEVCASQSPTGTRYTIGVHRLAFILGGGVIPDGQEAMHQCDVFYPVGDHAYRRCCNPAHIRSGTHQQNMREMLDKGRVNPLCGEQASHAKLTTEQVVAIRERYARGGIGHRALGAEFGVSGPAISYITRGICWGHVE